MIKIKNKNEIILNSSEKFRKLRLDALNSVEYLLEKIDPEERVKNCISRFDDKLKILDQNINLNEKTRIFLFSFGKAAIKMSRGFLSKINVHKGIVVSNVDYYDFPKNIEYIKSEHPIPGEKSLYAGERILEISKEIIEDDIVIFLISGGGSSLVEKPLISLSNLKNLTDIMLNNGLSIDEINIIRKHLSKIKGGNLIKRIKGKIFALVISDVVGDDLGTIASGPTYFDNSTFSDAFNIFKKYNIIDKIPKKVLDIIQKGIKGEIDETLKEKDYPKERVKNFIISSNYEACQILKEFFSHRGYSIFYLNSKIKGDVKEVSKFLAKFILDIYENKIEVKKPCALIFGGETVVFLKGRGIGGRNQELSLLVSQYIENKDIVFLSFGTDGIDGNSNAAGAIIDGDTIKRGKFLNLNINDFLENNDSYNYFKNLKDLIITGPTGNNVCDVGFSLIF